MIFESVKHITKKKEFQELILIYIRMIEIIANKNKMTVAIISEPSDAACSELISMGIIETSEDLVILKKVLGANYIHLISSVEFYINNKILYGNLLYRLSNKHRKELQDKVKKDNAPKFADFFSGAGGLSCGFSQAGFKVVFANDHEDVCAVHLELANKRGNWNSNGTASGYYQYETQGPDIYHRQGQDSIIKIWHIMKDASIENITDVGIKIYQ